MLALVIAVLIHQRWPVPSCAQSFSLLLLYWLQENESNIPCLTCHLLHVSRSPIPCQERPAPGDDCGGSSAAVGSPRPVRVSQCAAGCPRSECWRDAGVRMCSGGTGHGVGEAGTRTQHPPGCPVCQEGLSVGQMGAERVPPSTQGFASLGSSGCFSPFMSPAPHCGCVAVLVAVPCCSGGHFGQALPFLPSERPHILLGGFGCCPAGCLVPLPGASLRGTWLPQNEVGPPQKRPPGVEEIPVGTAKATHRTTGMAGDIVVGFRVISGERSSVGAQCLPAPPALPPAG